MSNNERWEECDVEVAGWCVPFVVDTAGSGSERRKTRRNPKEMRLERTGMFVAGRVRGKKTKGWAGRLIKERKLRKLRKHEPSSKW